MSKLSSSVLHKYAVVVCLDIDNACGCSDKKRWLVQKMENRQPATETQQLSILRGLVDADAFERFLASKFPASKVNPDNYITAKQCLESMQTQLTTRGFQLWFALVHCIASPHGPPTSLIDHDT